MKQVHMQEVRADKQSMLELLFELLVDCSRKRRAAALLLCSKVARLNHQLPARRTWSSVSCCPVSLCRAVSIRPKNVPGAPAVPDNAPAAGSGTPPAGVMQPLPAD